jgi:hypothetical protein
MVECNMHDQQIRFIALVDRFHRIHEDLGRFKIIHIDGVFENASGLGRKNVDQLFTKSIAQPGQDQSGMRKCIRQDHAGATAYPDDNRFPSSRDRQALPRPGDIQHLYKAVRADDPRLAQCAFPHPV